LQSLAKEYGVDTYRFGHIEEGKYTDDTSSYSAIATLTSVSYAGGCVRTCIDLHEDGVLEATQHGEHTSISTFMDKPLADVICINCGQCINRPETRASGFKEVDYGLTTREHAQMIEEAGLKLPDLPESGFDDPFGRASGAGLIFGATGGVMRATLRTVYELITGREVPFVNLNILLYRGFEGVRQASLTLKNEKPDWSFLEGVDLKFMIAHRTANAKQVLEAFKRGELDDVHSIEVTGCPGGCIGGGDQPIPTSLEIHQKRGSNLCRRCLSIGSEIA